MRRPHTPGRKRNPWLGLATEHRRSPTLTPDRGRNLGQKSGQKSIVPGLLEIQFSEHLRKLETRLFNEFKQLSEKTLDQNSALLTEQLNERIGNLEQISSIQSRAILNLRDSSKVADRRFSPVVNTTLEVAEYSRPEIEGPTTAVIEADPLDMEDLKRKHGFCPKCTSANVRRAYRNGVWEEFLRLFFIAPFRCRACRHKFYRF